MGRCMIYDFTNTYREHYCTLLQAKGMAPEDKGSQAEPGAPAAQDEDPRPENFHQTTVTDTDTDDSHRRERRK